MADKLSREEFMAFMSKKYEQLTAEKEGNPDSGDATPQAEGEVDPFKVTNEHFIAYYKELDYFPVVTPRGKMADKLKAAAPFNMFYTTVTAAPATHIHPLSITFQELLDPSLGPLECSLQITCYFEADWLLAHYERAGYSDKPLTVLYGELTVNTYEDEDEKDTEEKKKEEDENVGNAEKAHETNEDEKRREIKQAGDENIERAVRDKVDNKEKQDIGENDQKRLKDENGDENVQEVEKGQAKGMEEKDGTEKEKDKEINEKDNEDEIVVPENVEVEKVQMPVPFRLPHCKMMVLCYEDGSLRIVIGTANLIACDWDLMTQGIWISGSCRRLPSDATPEDGESRTNFKKDLLDFLSNYKSPFVAKYYERLKRADFSHINVCLVASVPGFHKSQSWGMRRMDYLLSRHCIVPRHEASRWEVYAQSSGIGEYGKKPQFWLAGAFLKSFSRALYEGRRRTSPPLRIIFPSLENTLAGHEGCHTCPYTDEVHNKQIWLEKFLHQWKADRTARSGSMPHVKTYVRVSPDLSQAAFFLLTSANISRSAWGSPNFLKDYLRINNFEAGVLFLPKFVIGADFFNLSEGARNRLLLPYDVPLSRYPPGMTPWLVKLKQAPTEDEPSASNKEGLSSEPK